MKKIKIKGVEYSYQVYNSTDIHTVTVFYSGVKKYTRRKYWLFGEKITVEKPIEVFKVYFDIESEFLTKKQVKYILLKRISILEREEEVKKGKLFLKNLQD